MGRILVLLSLLSFNAFAVVQPSSNGPSISMGCVGNNPCGIVEPPSNPDGWFTLHAGGSVTANQFRAFTKSGAAATGQYKVTGAAITCYHMSYNSASSSTRMQLASSTAADGTTAASLSAGQKYETGAAASFPHTATAGQTEYDKAIAYTFDLNSYPYIASDSTVVWGVVLTCR